MPRSMADHEQSQRKVLQRLQFVYGSPRSERRAIEVQQALMGTGHHRAVKLPDLLVAAVAEVEGLTVMHYDADFDRIAEVTGQPTQWVVEAGTVSKRLGKIGAPPSRVGGYVEFWSSAPATTLCVGSPTGAC